MGMGGGAKQMMWSLIFCQVNDGDGATGSGDTLITVVCNSTKGIGNSNEEMKVATGT